MSGWCPRCDAVRETDRTCPECQAPLVALDDRPRPPARDEAERAAELDAVVEPPKGRLRVAVAVAAVVLVGLAFVAGRTSGGTAVRAVSRATGAPTATTVAPAGQGERQLSWLAKPSAGVSLEVVSISRELNAQLPGEDLSGGGQGVETGDSIGTLNLRVKGLAGSRRLLGISGLRLIDSGGGVFADPDEQLLGGDDAVPVLPGSRPDSYLVNLGPTPSLDSLTSIEIDGLVLSAPPAGGTRIGLPSAGAWPARPPLREISPAARGVAVPVSLGGARGNDLELQISGAFVGAGRVVVVLGLDSDLGGDPRGLPLSTSILDGERVVCSRQSAIGGSGPPQSSPMLVVDCPTRPTPRLAVQLAAGVETVRLGVKLHD